MGDVRAPAQLKKPTLPPSRRRPEPPGVAAESRPRPLPPRSGERDGDRPREAERERVGSRSDRRRESSPAACAPGFLSADGCTNLQDAPRLHLPF